ncbi:MAG: Rrf2 family transcriptional regulator, partial [Oscillospiraceae bacterium]
MRISTKCSIALHCLLFIAEYESQTKVTSQLLSKSTGCNPVVIRNTLLALKKAGMISVARGVG